MSTIIFMPRIKMVGIYQNNDAGLTAASLMCVAAGFFIMSPFCIGMCNYLQNIYTHVRFIMYNYINRNPILF